MRKTLVSAIIAVAALLGGGVASATVITPGTWTVSPSGPVAGTSGTITITFPGGTITCASSTLNGTAVGTATGSPATLISLPPPGGLTFTNCTGPFGLTFTITIVGTWRVQGVTYDPVVGVTSGIISGITIRISGPSCTSTITGSVGFTYTNSTHQLRITSSNLTVTSVSGCFGLLAVGEHLSFSVTYTFPGLGITAVP